MNVKWNCGLRRYIKIQKEWKEMVLICSAFSASSYLQPLQKGKSPEWRLWLVISKCQQVLWTLLLVASTPEPFPSLLRLLSSHWQAAWKLGNLEGAFKICRAKKKKNLPRLVTRMYMSICGAALDKKHFGKGCWNAIKNGKLLSMSTFSILNHWNRKITEGFTAQKCQVFLYF